MSEKYVCSDTRLEARSGGRELNEWLIRTGREAERVVLHLGKVERLAVIVRWNKDLLLWEGRAAGENDSGFVYPRFRGTRETGLYAPYDGKDWYDED